MVKHVEPELTNQLKKIFLSYILFFIFEFAGKLAIPA